MTCHNQMVSICLDSFLGEAPIYFLSDRVEVEKGSYQKQILNRNEEKYQRLAQVLRLIATGYNVHAEKRRVGQKTPIERVTGLVIAGNDPVPCNGYRLKLFWKENTSSPYHPISGSFEVNVEDSCVRGMGFGGMEYIKVTLELNSTQPNVFYFPFSLYIHHDAPEANWFTWPAVNAGKR